MFLSYLQCSACEKQYEWQRLQNVCAACGKPLFAIYDLEAVRKLECFKHSSFQAREKSLWRWRELLPLPKDIKPVSLGEGLITDCGAEIAKRKEKEGWFDLSTLKEPYRIEGKKTLGYEIAEQLDWKLPDVILYPTGGGTGLIGMWKAFDEMERLGWIDNKRPRMFSVQASGCAPIVRAFDAGEKFAAEFPNAHTVASGLRVPKAIGDFLMLNILRESKGGAIAVDDDEMIRTVREVGDRKSVVVGKECRSRWSPYH